MKSDEIIRALRLCADKSENCEECRSGQCDCPFGETVLDCTERMNRAAADAIEALAGEVPHWIPVSKRLPEDDESLPRYSDSTMDVISVFACGYLNGDDKLSVEEVNRLLIKKTGIRQIDEQHTGKWEWSKHFKEIVYWQPLPAAPKEEK